MAIAACLVQGVCSAREWVSNDGRKLVADFVSATATEVTVIRLSDRKEFTLMLRTLSEADQKWVAENSGAIGAGSSNLRLGMEVGNETEDGTYSKHFTGKWVMAEYRDLPYAIYAGEKLDSSKKYPLILGLHGKSDNNENGKQTGILGKFTGLHQYEKTPAILVAPLCFQPYGGTGGGWDDRPGKLALNLIKDIIRKTPMVDDSRVYILGHSMGGGGTVSLLKDEPNLFAAGIVIAGWADASAVNIFRKVPVWAFHGADDDVVSPDRMRAMAKKLKRSNKFIYTEYPGEGHGITGKVFGDEKVLAWLFEQKR
ncbi:MAG: prolyl oligopeptidase family serine peptidase [Verrucomicrobiae bacterium]|nr:prolyl oligopeptidase family serine peptidase [Verrucomicrobiae bacterium]